MFRVYQHWDPLKVCVVGQSYGPDFYHWIRNIETRRRFQKMAEETEEDYQNLIHLLENKFGVKTIRPALPGDLSTLKLDGRWIQPPVTPRDYYLMIHDKFWIPTIPNRSFADNLFKNQDVLSRDEFDRRDQAQHEAKLSCYQNIFDLVRSQGNEICFTQLDVISGCFVSRIGRDLFFATQSYDQDQDQLKQQMDQLFPTTRNRIVNAGGHGDATYCPVTPGLIISLRDIPTYTNTFPDWEVVYLPPSDYAHMREFEASMKRTKGRWHMPGFEQDQNLVNMVEYYFDTWVGQVSETVFDVNILIVDPKNIVVSAHNDQVESACARYGIDVHVVPFRHKYFWDCGIHCITNDLDREGHLSSFLEGSHV